MAEDVAKGTSRTGASGSGGCGKGFLCWRTDPKRRDEDDVDGANCRLTDLKVQVAPVQRIATGKGGGCYGKV